MLSGIRPILQVFSQISLFENKFAELFYLIPASDGVSLCIDAVLIPNTVTVKSSRSLYLLLSARFSVFRCCLHSIR